MGKMLPGRLLKLKTEVAEKEAVYQFAALSAKKPVAASHLLRPKMPSISSRSDRSFTSHFVYENWRDPMGSEPNLLLTRGPRVLFCG
jgi:hypothetical protein